MFIAYKKTIFLPRQARDKHRQKALSKEAFSPHLQVKAFFNTKQTEQCCGQGVTEIAGTAESLGVTVAMTVSDTEAKFTLTGPSTVWFGAEEKR